MEECAPILHAPTIVTAAVRCQRGAAKFEAQPGEFLPGGLQRDAGTGAAIYLSAGAGPCGEGASDRQDLGRSAGLFRAIRGGTVEGAGTVPPRRERSRSQYGGRARTV